MLMVLTDNIIDQNHFGNIIRTSLSNSVKHFGPEVLLPLMNFLNESLRYIYIHTDTDRDTQRQKHKHIRIHANTYSYIY